MVSLLLAVIYLAFVSLGLPDSLFGSAWPVMQGQFEVPVSYAGGVSVIIASGTVVSSLLSDRATKRLGAGKVTAVSVLMTTVALFGFSCSKAFWQLCVCAVPYGLGAGAVDAALNNYVALHYKARHMSWIHFFWGVGAAAGPSIMGACLTGGFQWPVGYQIIGGIQLVMTLALFLSLPLWKKQEETDSGEKKKALSLAQVLKIPGVTVGLAAFFCYSVVPQTSMLWASSYLVQDRGVEKELAAFFGSLYVGGITLGRLFTGFITEKLGDRNMIRISTGVILIGIGMILLPTAETAFALWGLVVLGVGCAPVFPAVIHSTPGNFGRENSQAVVGVQMAAAYTCATVMPALFGLLAQQIGIWLYPVYILVFLLISIFLFERLNATVKKEQSKRRV